MCHSCYTKPKSVVGMLMRISIGLSLVFIGITHYRGIGAFTGAVSGGLGTLEPLGVVWAYVLPGLMIIGGVLFVAGMYMNIGAWAAGIAIGSIPAGLMLKSALTGVPLEQTMPATINALTWLLVIYFASKSSCSWGGKYMSASKEDACGCGSENCSSCAEKCGCGSAECGCGSEKCGCGPEKCGCGSEGCGCGKC
ncbi:MAG: hypothetical protein Q7R81_06960 [Candidatus Peregrinibacteria bacterium]|nr:hypothetical protein [Candidatus Peregrinibacteria bacterium]